MSSLARRLRGIFTAPLPATTKTPAKTIKRSSSNNSTLKEMVDKFKKSSGSKRFRSHYGYYEKAVLTLATAKKFSFIEDILEHQKQYNEISTEVFAVRLITLYGKAGMFEHAYKLFDEMPKLNCERTKFDKIDGFFQELPGNLGIVPDVVSYNIIVNAFCEMGSLDSALSVLDEMEKVGLEPDLITFNTLLNAFYQNGSYADGEKIWDLMKKNNVAPNVRSYNAKLRGLISENRMSEAVELIDEMKTSGIKPDVFTLSSLMKGFCNSGNLEEAKRWYSEIAKNELPPVRATYMILIPFLVEKGDFEMATELCKEVFSRRWLIEPALLQQVLEGLVKESKIEEATELVKLAKSKKFRITLELPSDKYYIFLLNFCSDLTQQAPSLAYDSF
ncbi:hypothetical protein PVL29_012695 [Vitis rotundifolia]|uniref:Pentatricopeptide repeat-containing protein n=1 Tax=Vitis rotundifolia TaxID=103349 RepID=A0AA38ZJU2_VITRO|nr:hypothetical protein PVL29_012695 [Vitis rotundifolia]